MKHIFFIIVFVIPFLIGCKDQQKEIYILQIEELENKLENINQTVNETDTQYDPMYNEKVTELISAIKEIYIGDTFDFDIAENIDSYQEIGNILSINSGNLAKAKQAIPEVKENLSKLKHDIKNSINERDRYQEFLDFETQQVKEIEEVLNYYLQTKNKYEKRFDTLHPIIVNFIENYKD